MINVPKKWMRKSITKPHGYQWGIVTLSLLLLLITGVNSFAAESKKLDRPKIGLVLSGGGARGAAHIGVIKVLEKLRIPIDYITGTSMGSIVGGLYSSGMSITELEKVVTGLDWANAFKDLIPREDRSFRRKLDDKTYLVKGQPGLSDDLEIKLPSGLIQGQKINLILKRLALPVSSVRDFDEFPIPFRAVATDLTTGEPVILGSGDLAMAMRASMSVPAAFSPVEIDGKLLGDGGVSNNLPIDIARDMGADIIIAVDISTPLAGREKLTSVLKISQQLTGILTRKNTEAQIAMLTDKDIFILPDLGDISSAAFDRADETIPIGIKATERKKPELRKLSQTEESYDLYKNSQQTAFAKRVETAPVIYFVRLDNRSRLSDEVLLARLKIKEGQAIYIAELEKDIGKIYGLDRFESIYYEFIEENGQSGVLIHVRERSWGPNYIQPGLTLSNNQDGDSSFNLGFAYTRTAINRLDGEWRTAFQIGDTPLVFTEIHQPLDVTSQYFINPRLIYGINNVNIFALNGDRLSEYRVSKLGVNFAAGRTFGTWGETRIGIKRLTGDTELKTGINIMPDYDYDRGELYLRLSADKLDNLDFPRHGYAFFTEYSLSDEDFGADSSFDQVRVDLTLAKSWESHTLLVGTRYYSTIDKNAPLQNRFKLGGLFNLSGYNEDELSGQQLGLMRMAYMRRIGDFNLLPAYIGATIESGNVWENKSNMDFDDLILAGSVFVGVDSMLGPVYLGYGQAEGNNNNFYFALGKVF